MKLAQAIIMIPCLLLSSCASLNFVNENNEKIKNAEPKVSFIDKRRLNTSSSPLIAIEPEQVIASYTRLLKRGDPEVRSESLRRLADITMRLAESKLGADNPNDPSLSLAVKKASFSSVINLYQQLLSEFPKYEQSADVKYQLARAYALNSDSEKSLTILDQIVITPSKTDSYIESQFRRGESYFVRKKYNIAEKAYGAVISKGDGSTFYDKALYKRGWSLFKQSIYPEAQKDFFSLFERLTGSLQSKKILSKINDDLIIDTKRVISLGFYNQDGPESIKQYFNEHANKTYENEIYQSLASLYIEQERFQDAADTYLGFISLKPLSIVSPLFHSEVINIYKKGGFPSLILPAKQSFVENYGRNSAFWAHHQGKVSDGLTLQLIEHLNDISVFYHAKAQASKKPADFLIAAKWYQEILDTFNDPTLDSQYRFAMAEALTGGKKLIQAAKEYEVVAYVNPKTKFSRDAGYRSLVAYQSLLSSKTSSNKKALVKNDMLPNVIVSSRKFIKKFPTDKEANGILSNMIEHSLSLNKISDAIESSRQLLTMPVPPTQKQLTRAMVIIANGLFDLKQYKQAELAITNLFKDVKLTSKQKKQFHQRRAEAIYKQADASRISRDYTVAVGLFLKILKLEPNTLVAVNAHFDAATLLLKTKKWERSARLFEQFRAKHPKNKLSQGIPEKLAFIYEEKKDWNKAADEFKRLAKNNKDQKLAAEGYWHVADLYLKSHSTIKAIAAFKHYVWTYPKPYLLAQEGRNHLIELYKQTSEKNKVIFWRQKIIQSYAKNKAMNNARTRFLAAESKYILSEPLFNRYKKLKLMLPLAKSLKKKRNAMKKSLSAYSAISSYQVAQYTSAATHKIALIYQLLSNELMNSQKPKGLNEEELEEYGYLLEDQALPFEDKAIKLFEVNAERTKDNIYNQYIRDSIQSLSKLKPAQYNKKEVLGGIENVSF